MDIQTITSWAQLVWWIVAIAVWIFRFMRRKWGLPQARVLSMITKHVSFNKILITIVIIGLLGSGFSLYLNYSEKYDARPSFITVSNKEFINEKIPLDGYEYKDCTFTNVTFVFNGRAAARFHYNKIIGGCVITSDNTAIIATAQMLKGLGFVKEDILFLHSSESVESPKMVP